MVDGDFAPAKPLDEASSGFKSLETRLGKKQARTTRAREDVNAVVALAETWFRVYRPQIVSALGALPAVEQMDRYARDLRVMVASRAVIADLRRTLRSIVRLVDREILPAYDAARWTSASTVDQSPTEIRESLAARLDALSPELAVSYRQVHTDLMDDERQTFLGPAGEIREVMRAVIHLMAPDGEVSEQDWFVGHDGHPTQAERIRYVMQSRSTAESPMETADVVDTKVGLLGRQLYQRASRAFHVGTQREELRKILGWVEAVLNEILPPLADA